MNNEYLKQIYGLLESGATLGTGAVSGLVGLPYGLYKGVTSGSYGTPQAPRIAAREAQQFMERNTYQPRTAEGQANLQQLAGLLEASKLPPIMPEASLLAAIPKQAYAAQAVRTGMAAEKAIAPVVTRTMERGGMPAGLLEGMATNTTSRMFVPATKEEAFKAAQLLKSGKSEKDVWKQIGVGKAPDGEWRKEISDKASKYDPEALADLRFLDDFDYMKHTQPLGGTLEHEQLYKLYPELSDMPVHFMPAERMKGAYAAYSPTHDRITLSDQLSPEKARSSALHEIQHAIQEREGFAVGGNQRDFAKIRYEAEQQIGSLNDKMREIVKQMDNPSIEKQDKDVLRTQYEDLMNERMSLVKNAQIDPMEAYGNLMGEAEARLTQRRMDLGPRQRLENFPFEYTGETGYGLDVPLEGLIQMTPEGTIIKRGLLGQ